jgi:hypothetical protein
VTALMAYTFAKNLSDLTNADNPYNRQAERSYASFDVPQRLTTMVAWDLPFGRGRRFGANAPRAVNFVAGGWTISNFNTFQAGFPLAFGLAKCTAGANSCRPNVMGDPSQGVTGSIESRLSNYFNTAAFGQPADFTFGNASPYIGSVRSPGMNNSDTTISKDFQMTEKAKFQFRVSAFNTLNHPVFGAPGVTLGNANFGRISSQANVSRQFEFAAKILF